MKNAQRIEKLRKMGLKFDGSQFVLNDINIHWTEIVSLDDKDFDELVEKVRVEIERRKQ
jgi:lipid II:glycine glycyltransferase (peptidoglycan interpeptide bridge formation enzyme)